MDEIDTSPLAIRAFLVDPSNINSKLYRESSLIISALAAERDSLAARLAEAEWKPSDASSMREATANGKANHITSDPIAWWLNYFNHCDTHQTTLTTKEEINMVVAKREGLGRVVREAWVAWALSYPNPKPHWLIPYDDLTEYDKEADRRIGEAVFRNTLVSIRSLPLSPDTRDGEIAELRAELEKTEVDLRGERTLTAVSQKQYKRAKAENATLRSNVATATEALASAEETIREFVCEIEDGGSITFSREYTQRHREARDRARRALAALDAVTPSKGG